MTVVSHELRDIVVQHFMETCMHHETVMEFALVHTEIDSVQTMETCWTNEHQMTDSGDEKQVGDIVERTMIGEYATCIRE